MPSPTLPLPRPKRTTTDGARAPRTALAAAGIVAVAAAAGWLALRPRPLPVLGVVPPFALTERVGTPVTADRLAGRVWIADFVFTRCPDFCPALTARMAGLQKTLPQDGDPVLLVSFSVDPSNDTPEVLRDYATRAHAGESWLFLTGTRDAMATLLRDGFHVAWADGGPPASPITHSDRFVLVDRRLQIRGYYHGTDPADLARLTRDAAALRDGRIA